MVRNALVFIWLFSSLMVFAGPPGEILFIENKNQWPSNYKFATDLPSGHVRFAADHIFFSFWETKPASNANEKAESERYQQVGEGGKYMPSVAGHSYMVTFVGANTDLSITGRDATETRHNYFLGDDPARWASNARSYGTLLYGGIYRGIDMKYYADKGRMKYEWIVSPQVDPSVIKVKYTGQKSIYLDNDNLHIETSVNEIWEMKPYAYQVKNGKTFEITCRYRLNGNVLSYDFPDGYDECETLVIDPILIFSAYSGSTLNNWGNTATYDDRGNVYSGGIVTNLGTQTGFPLTPGAFQIKYGGGAWDIGILKYDSAGQNLLYSTYLGGNGSEVPQSLVVNKLGELLILGVTGSSNFPVTNGSSFRGGPSIEPIPAIPFDNGSDIFVARLSVNGDRLLGSTYLGGSANDGVNFISGSMNSATDRAESPLARNYGDQLRGDIITDDDNNVYISSCTRSLDFPALNAFAGGSHDAVVVKLKSDLSGVIWSRMIGGSGTDAAYSIRLDTEGNIFVGGGSTSASLPGINGFKTTNSGNVDGWVLSLTSNGEVLNGTFLGTANYDQVYFVDLNERDEVFVFGQTLGTYVPGRTGRQFVQKLSHDLKVAAWARVIGTGTISPTAFLVSECGYIYLSGWGGVTNATHSTTDNGVIIVRNYIGGSTTGLPVTPDAYQRTTSGNDFYLLVLSEDGSENLYATFLGGNQSATHVDGGTSRFDKKGIVYHAVCAGCGGFSDFPAVNVPLAHRRNRSSRCNNAVFKFDLSLLKARLQTNTIRLDMPGFNRVCLNDPIVFQNLSNGGETFEWDLGDGTQLTKTDTAMFTHVYKNTGRYQVWLKAIDRGTCQVVDSVSTFVYVSKLNAWVQPDDKMCKGDSYQLRAEGGDQYFWRSEDNVFQSNDKRPFISPEQTTTYYVNVAEDEGCIYSDLVTITVVDQLFPDFEIERIGDCRSIPSVRVVNLTTDITAGDEVYFDFGDGYRDDRDEVLHQYSTPGDYNIKLVTSRDICTKEKVVPMTIRELVVPNVITPKERDGKNDVFFIEIGKGTGLSPADIGVKVDLIVYNRWGKTVYENDDYQNDWSAPDVGEGVYFYVVKIADYGTCRSWLHIIK